MEIKTVQAGTAALQGIFDRWAALDKRREDVRRNDDLSAVGKQKAYASIETARALLRDDGYDAFTAEYERQRRAMEANSKARGKALENGLARWENLRNAIDLETERVTRLLKMNRTGSDLLREFKQSRDSGALVIAWRRALTEFSTNDALLPLVSEVKKEYEAIQDTPELQKVNARGTELADAALQLRTDTISFMNLLSRVNDVSGVIGQLQNLMQQIKVTPLTKGAMYVEFVDSPSDAFQKFAQPETLITQ